MVEVKTDEKEVIDRKLSRVGGSVIVAIPKAIRRALNLGVGDRVKMWSVEGDYVIIKKYKGVRDEGTRFRD